MAKKMMETKFILLFLALVLIVGNGAFAIDVPSGDFDAIDVDPDDGDNWIYIENVVDGDWIEWQLGGSPWIGRNYGGGYPTMGHTGAQWVDMNGSYIYQALNATYVEGVTYEIAVRATTDQADQTMYLYFIDSDWSTTFMDSGEIVVPAGDLSVWNRYSAQYAATAEVAGKQIGIAIWGEYDTYVDTITLVMKGKSDPVAPLQGAENVGVDVILSWTAPVDFEALGYDVYFGTDPNILNRTLVIDNELANTYDPPGDLEYETTYYWWVDVYEPNDAPIKHNGPGWSFTTATQKPTVLTDPVSVLVESGSVAELNVEHFNGTSYQWHKVGVGVVDSGTTVSEETITLTIDSVTQADEGNYFCRIINDAAPGGVDTGTAKVMTKRLIGHWPMDGSGDDRNVADSSLGGVDGTVVTRDVTDIEAVVTGDAGWSWVDGIDGGALNLAQESANANVHDYVILATSGDDADLEFGESTDFSVSIWVKGTDFNVGESDAAVISNKNWNSGGNAGWVIDVSGGSNQLEWNIGGGGRADYDPAGGTLLNDGAWHHIAVTHDRDGLATFYIDGVLQDQVSIAHIDDIDSGYPTVIGTDGYEGRQWGAWFRGTIDDVRMWNYVLSPYAVASMYLDFVPTAEKWCVENTSIPDYNDNCMLDLGDFATIALKWLDCNIVPDCLAQHDYMVD